MLHPLFVSTCFSVIYLLFHTFPSSNAFDLHHYYVALSVGSNDVCDASLSPECIVEGLMDLSRTLLTKFGVTRVIVCLILHRSNWTHHMRGLTLAAYNARVDMVNRFLQRRLRKNGHITFWKHHGCIGPNHLGDDGVHLNEKGLRMYRRSLYTALTYNLY